MTSAAYPIWTSDHLDYRALITYLSQHASYPCSLHIRNHLLAPYAAQVAHPALGAGVAVDDDPWRTWHDYRRGASVAAIGAVPKCVLEQKSDGSGKLANGVHTEETLWALVTVAPNYAPGWIDPLAEDLGQDSMRFSMWLSTEKPLSSVTGGAATDAEIIARRASEEELRLIRFICKQHIPACMARLATVAPATLQYVPRELSTSDNDTRAMITIFSVYHPWVEAMQSGLWDKDDDTTTTDDVQVVRVNLCTNFVLSEDQAHVMAAEVFKRSKSSNWSVTRIGASEHSHRMILDANNVAFPAWYVRHRRHLSVLVCDGEDPSPVSALAAEEYPTQRRAGAPAGWAYAHDECSVASLHVAEPYRRLCHGNDGSNGVSVGRLCVAHMAGQLIAAQRDALARAGLTSAALPAPLFSTAESHKIAAIGFHRKMGFTPSVPSTWGALAVCLPSTL